MALDLFGMSVLIVDDELVTRTVVAQILGSMGPPKIYQADNGAQALDYLSPESGGVDFVIADFNMPVMHGLELLKAIRTGELDIRRSTPVAMLTGYSDKGLVDLALALDINAFLIKPVTKRGLELRLASMLEQSKTDLWLKSNTIYQEIDVGPVLEDIVGEAIDRDHPGDHDSGAGKPAPERESEPLTSESFRSRRMFFKREEQPLFRDYKAVAAEAAANKGVGTDGQAQRRESGTASSAPSQTIHERLVTPEDIPEGATLMRDVHTADGRLFMQSGTELTPRVISILIDLEELDHPVDGVWIAE